MRRFTFTQGVDCKGSPRLCLRLEDANNHVNKQVEAMVSTWHTRRVDDKLKRSWN